MEKFHCNVGEVPSDGIILLLYNAFGSFAGGMAVFSRCPGGGDSVAWCCTSDMD
jgi:hypothetical protein